MFCSMLLLLILATPTHAPADLAESVIDYWSALARRDKVSAMKVVYEEDLNNFLNRPEPEFRNPQLVGIEKTSENEADVTVSIERFLPNGVFEFKAKEHWVRTETGWKVRIDPPVDVATRIAKTVKEISAEPMPKELKISPDQVVFYALNPKQPAILTIANGLDTPAAIKSIRMDETRIRQVKEVKTVAPGTSAALEFEYVGPRLDETNVADTLMIQIEQNGEIREFLIPVTYNYMNEIQRWIRQQQSGGHRTKKP